MDLELLTKPRDGFHLGKRHRGSFVEFELRPIVSLSCGRSSTVGIPFEVERSCAWSMRQPSSRRLRLAAQ